MPPPKLLCCLLVVDDVEGWAAEWLWVLQAAAGGCFWAARLAPVCTLLLECTWEDCTPALLLECAWEDCTPGLLWLCLTAGAAKVCCAAALLTLGAEFLLPAAVCCW